LRQRLVLIKVHGRFLLKKRNTITYLSSAKEKAASLNEVAA
jgi:hypothetical protein